MAKPVIMLVDNGSSRAAATLGLRDIARRLAVSSGREIAPVSLQHADKIPAEGLGGEGALVFTDFLRNRLLAGEREFLVLPLFFGRSRALTDFIPRQVELLTGEFGELDLRQAEVLSPLPDGEPRLAEILGDHVAQCGQAAGRQPDQVIVVDHGSPLPEVTAVRKRVADALHTSLAPGVELKQAVMERRPGADYDFNGHLLEEQLDAVIPGPDGALVILAMLFLSPGRHAGPEGDIETICRAAEARNPGLEVRISPLVGEHPLLIDILRSRLDAAL